MKGMLEADPNLIARWADAWAMSRGAAMPVASDGGLYIHVGSEEQIGRYIFAGLDADAIRPLAAKIDRPLLYLKVCAPADAVAPLLPPNWKIATPGYMMTATVATMLQKTAALSTEFSLSMRTEGVISFVHIAHILGEEAARGRIIAMDDLVVFDRIATAPQYQRCGLGSAVMRALAAHAYDLGIRNAILCATPSGRALYTALGWRLHSDYTTASLRP